MKTVVSPRWANRLIDAGVVLGKGYVISQDVNLDNQMLREENQALQKENAEIKLMIKKTLRSVVLNPDNLSKVFALAMAVDERIPKESQDIAKEQVLGEGK